MNIRTNKIRDEETRILTRHQAESDAWGLTTGSFAAVFFLLTVIICTLCGVVMKMALATHAQAERILQALPQPSASTPASR